MTLENNRNVMLERLQAIPGVKVTKPDGTFYCFPDFSAYMKDSQKLASFLLQKVRVVAVPGKEFGFEGHLRLSYCGAMKDITEGCERIQWALDPTPLTSCTWATGSWSETGFRKRGIRCQVSGVRLRMTWRFLLTTRGR